MYESPLRKAPDVHPFEIQAECVRGALADAGLEPGDVDGFCTAAALRAPRAARQMNVAEVAEYLGLQPRWFDSTDIGGAAFLTHAGHAALAIAAGLIDVAVVSYARERALEPGRTCRTTTRNAWGPAQCEVPYGPSTVSTYALAAQRHMHEYGTTPEQLAQIAVQCRANAADNPRRALPRPAHGRGRDQRRAEIAEPARPLRLLRRDRLRRRLRARLAQARRATLRASRSTCSASARRSARSR